MLISNNPIGIFEFLSVTVETSSNTTIAPKRPSERWTALWEWYQNVPAFSACKIYVKMFAGEIGLIRTQMLSVHLVCVEIREHKLCYIIKISSLQYILQCFGLIFKIPRYNKKKFIFG